jgi:hypothetical protein
MVAVLSTTVCAAQEVKKSDPAKQRQETRMALMRGRVKALSAMGAGDEKLEFSAEPLLRYNDLARDVADASLWALGPKGRPRALLVVEVYWKENFVQYEFPVVADPPRLVRGPFFGWKPRAAPFTWLKLPDEAPHATQNIRRRQFRQVAEKFSASEDWQGQTSQLRLMPRPILEYEDKEKGVIEGEVFVWAHGTNVEILMFLEARQGEDGAKNWVAGFRRVSGADLHVDYKGQDFWNDVRGVSRSEDDSFYARESLTAAEREAFAPQ